MPMIMTMILNMIRKILKIKDIQGFTLIELLIAISIVSIVCAAAIPSVRLVERYELGVAGTMLKSDIEYIQRMSMIDASEHSIILNSTGYVIYDGRAAKPIKEVTLPSMAGYSCKIGFASSNEICFTTVGTTKFGAGEIVIFSDNFSVRMTMSLGTGRIKLNPVEVAR